jgi:hypothetical protein
MGQQFCMSMHSPIFLWVWLHVKVMHDKMHDTMIFYLFFIADGYRFSPLSSLGFPLSPMGAFSQRPPESAWSLLAWAMRREEKEWWTSAAAN